MNKFILILLFSLTMTAQADKVIDINLKLILVDSLDDIPMNKFANKKGEKHPYLGSALNLPEGGCIVHVQPPRDVNDIHRMEILGHEIVHCYKGKYHE